VYNLIVVLADKSVRFSVYLDFLVSSRGSDLPKNVPVNKGSANKIYPKTDFLLRHDFRQGALSNGVKSPAPKKDWLLYTPEQATQT